ncbi:hypothetical protein [Hymenobacter cavernae]|uniref:PCRF domain-containing protein n=1 Tax=Hymenobacter cavernae TaxID=2044852 RepID=A0ABQ1UDP3_9BACT|nr:hypothetical protein [Hymenobacter cavernae]GGF14053.1 hypothetical protein GCM10011383_26630 [Hymenobacter cavernae]
MSSNLEYLDPALIPLEQKVIAYLAAEEELRKATVAARNLPVTEAKIAEAEAEFDQRPATGSFDQEADEVQQKLQNMHEDLEALRQEVLELLPVRDEFVKVNLGYGPSRVGAFTVTALDGAVDYELRIVH